MNRTIAPVVALAVGTFAVLGAGSVRASSDAPNAIDRTFAMKVGQGNIAEIQASRLALKKSPTAGVRHIAMMLIQQHGDAQTALMQAGAQTHVMVPNDTDPMHKAEGRKLMHLSGRSFDKVYLTGLVRDHYKTIALFNKELTSGSNSTIHGFAARYLPDIETHTQHIVAQADKYGIQTASHVAGHHMGAAGSASMSATRP